MNLRSKRTILFALVAFLAFLVVLFSNSNWLKIMYPIHFKKEIADASVRYQVDPLLIAAVIRVESNYKTNSESRKGAYGIMQLMPDTAEWLLSMDDGMKKYRVKDLDDPKVNILLGSKYLNYLSKEFDGNRPQMLAAYNAGHGKVSKWLQEKIWDGTFENTNQIPFKETRNYVNSVEYYYKKYGKIYAGESFAGK